MIDRVTSQMGLIDRLFSMREAEQSKAAKDTIQQAVETIRAFVELTADQAVAINNYRNEVDREISFLNLKDEKIASLREELRIVKLTRDDVAKAVDFAGKDRHVEVPVYKGNYNVFYCPCGRKLKCGQGTAPHLRYHYCPNCGAFLLWSEAKYWDEKTYFEALERQV